MSYPSSRRVQAPSIQQPHPRYAAVPQSPRRSVSGSSQATPFTPSVVSRRPVPSFAPELSYGPGFGTGHVSLQNETAHGVQVGELGGGLGPYTYHPGSVRGAMSRESKFSAVPSESSSSGPEHGIPATTATIPPYLWDAKDPDLDDALHNPDPIRDAQLDRSWTFYSPRGWANMSLLVILVVGLIILFAGYPIIAQYNKVELQIPGFNIGGINGSGQVPDLPGFPRMIDIDTPSEAMTRTGNDGQPYTLVFSDEFNSDGRTFYPGDDPYWEAVDLNYWPTGDLEWYDPAAVTTQGGNMVITMTEEQTHNLNFQSGMVTSWNKFCFTTGYIEVNVSLPENSVTPGLWPAIWTMGNLGRAGYGATTEGTWPYSYAACDLGTFPNQTNVGGTSPQAALTTGAGTGGQLSYLPGQRLSACTCDGSDHPGPNVATGRNVPEIDVLEAQVDTVRRVGEVSQSFQVAPYNANYQFDDSSPATSINDPTVTNFNGYKGGIYQQAVSAVSDIDSANYGGTGYATYGFEWWSDPNNRDDGFITWYSQGQPSWQITSASIGPDSQTGISQRIVSEEPHYIILNLGMAHSFQPADYKNLQFPAQLYIDYIRVYQREGSTNTGCDPSSRPTMDYINNHLNAYSNPNLTTWNGAGYDFPRNSIYDGC